MSTVEAAEKLANRAHWGRRYGDQPYIVHPADVARRVAANGPNAVMAAWLHDVVEDSDYTLDDLRNAGYPDEVVDAVDACTQRDDEPYLEFVARAAKHPLGRIVKLADNASNTAALHTVRNAERRDRLRRKYDEARPILFLAAG